MDRISFELQVHIPVLSIRHLHKILPYCFHEILTQTLVKQKIFFTVHYTVCTTKLLFLALLPPNALLKALFCTDKAHGRQNRAVQLQQKVLKALSFRMSHFKRSKLILGQLGMKHSQFLNMAVLAEASVVHSFQPIGNQH